MSSFQRVEIEGFHCIQRCPHFRGWNRGVHCTRYRGYAITFLLVVVADLDRVEYTIQEEYQARINFQALDQLDPAIRARIDLELLARLTNTDPEKLEKYRTMDKDFLKSSIAGLPTPTNYDIISLHQENLKSLDRQLSSQLQQSSGLESSTGLRRTRSFSYISSMKIDGTSKGQHRPMTFIVQREEREENQESEKDFLRVFEMSTSSSPRSMTSQRSMTSPRSMVSSRSMTNVNKVIELEPKEEVEKKGAAIEDEGVTKEEVEREEAAKEEVEREEAAKEEVEREEAAKEEVEREEAAKEEVEREEAAKEEVEENGPSKIEKKGTVMVEVEIEMAKEVEKKRAAKEEVEKKGIVIEMTELSK